MVFGMATERIGGNTFVATSLKAASASCMSQLRAFISLKPEAGLDVRQTVGDQSG